jgi:hypothetical protein
MATLVLSGSSASTLVLTIRNNSDEELKICPYTIEALNTGLAGRSIWSCTDAKGAIVNYVGPMFRRVAPDESDYTRVAVQAELVVNGDITGMFPGLGAGSSVTAEIFHNGFVKSNTLTLTE